VAFKENHELIQRGPYRYVRHPICSGLFLMVLGGAVLYGTLGALVALVVICVVVSRKSRQEEQLMNKHLPEAYGKYKARESVCPPRDLEIRRGPLAS
jgi:protein-S-isoprenylcysteine O-methyltransferase Ste14